MKSIQTLRAHYIPASEKAQYSDLIVLRAGSQYCLGTVYKSSSSSTFTEPGSRDTSYLETKSQAELALRILEKMFVDMVGQMEEKIIENWEATMLSRYNVEIFYRYNP